MLSPGRWRPGPHSICLSKRSSRSPSLQIVVELPELERIVVQSHVTADDSDDVVLTVAAKHPAQAVIGHALGKLHAADEFKLTDRRGGIRGEQIEVIDPVRSDPRVEYRRP